MRKRIFTLLLALAAVTAGAWAQVQQTMQQTIMFLPMVQSAK